MSEREKSDDGSPTVSPSAIQPFCTVPLFPVPRSGVSHFFSDSLDRGETRAFGSFAFLGQLRPSLVQLRPD